jgi:putative holliday junction resolvase
LLAADASRAKRADVVDKMAAAYILQGALDRYERIRPGEESDDDLAE